MAEPSNEKPQAGYVTVRKGKTFLLYWATFEREKDFEVPHAYRPKTKRGEALAGFGLNQKARKGLGFRQTKG